MTLRSDVLRYQYSGYHYGVALDLWEKDSATLYGRLTHMTILLGDPMTDVIDFLERMGQDARCREATGAMLQSLLTETRLGADIRSAIVDKDAPRLQQLLGQAAQYSVQFPADEEDEDSEGDEEEISFLRRDQVVSRLYARVPAAVV